MPKLTIDGIEFEAEAGSSVLQACEQLGIEIPRFCYHERLSVAGNCRMCLVEMERSPKPVASCAMPVAEGMVIHTNTETVKKARNGVMEFLLLNHPLDCPICDAAGQCMLQDYAFETEQLRSRYAEAKLVLGRDRVADDILYFGDRCIVCTRCVRFMEDLAGDNSLIVAQRGHKAYIDTFPGAVLDHPFRGNIVDVCPVGALVHEDYLFKARAWDLDSAASICPGCSTGCNVDIGVKENQVVRVKPRLNPEVNAYWMCDHGRRHLVMSNRGVRAEVPLIRREGELEPVAWAEAIGWVASRLRAVQGGQALASPTEACESLFLFRDLMDRLGMSGGAFRVSAGEEAVLEGFPTLRLRAERAPNAAGARLFGFTAGDLPQPGSEALLVLGDGLTEAAPTWGAEADPFIYIGSHLPAAARNAVAVLPITTFAEMEGTFLNSEGRLQRFHQALQPPGVARPAWMILSALLAALDAGDGVLDAPAAFRRMASGTSVLEGVTWSDLGLRGRIVDAIAAPVAVSD